MDNSTFHLRYAPDQKLNVRLIENTDIKNILRGNVRDLLGVMNDLAYVDVENDEFIQASPEAMKLYKLTQFGLQYMMYTVSKLGDNVLLIKDYIKIQEDKRIKLAELVQNQEETIRRLKKKKKAMIETEKNYVNILKALQLDSNMPTSKENVNSNRLMGYDSEPDRRNKNAGLSKRSPLRKKDGQGPEEGNAGKPPLKNNQGDRIPTETGQETTNTNAPKDPFAILKERFDQLPMSEKQEFRKFVIQESFGKGPGLGALGLNLGGEGSLGNSQAEPKKEEKTLPKLQPAGAERETFAMQSAIQSAIKVEDNSKEEGEVDDDEYLDDFELSESAKFSRVVLDKSGFHKEEKRNPDDTLSIDSKEFSESYVNLEAMKNNLEAIKNKVKPTVDVDVKGFKNT